MSLISKQVLLIKQQAAAAPWLKWAALVATVLGALIAVQSLHEILGKQQKAAIDAENNLRKVLALNGQDVWLEREKRATELHTSLLHQLPQTATAGLAQAALQGWLRDATSMFGPNQNMRITVNRAGEMEQMPGVLRVNAAVSGNLSPRQSLGLIQKIESSPNLIVVESISLQSDSSNVLQLTLNAYYRLNGSTEE